MENQSKVGSYIFGISDDAKMVIGFKSELYPRIMQYNDTYWYVAGLNGSTNGNTKVYRSIEAFLSRLNDKMVNEGYIYVLVDVSKAKPTEDHYHSIQYYSHGIKFEDTPNPNVPYLEQYPI